MIDSGPEIMAPNDESRAGDGVFVEHRGKHTQSHFATLFSRSLQDSFPFLIFLSALIFLCMEESFRIVGDGVISPYGINTPAERELLHQAEFRSLAPCAVRVGAFVIY